ncbi:MAG: transporter substrate-binding domain-containing protein, partial [Deltaproteobacteria bacterium]|nr:transporter substrate-binding domain-containing protein [Deltaproteobacteria bacterium]
MVKFWLSLFMRSRLPLLILLTAILASGLMLYAAEEPPLQTKMQANVTQPILPPQSQIQEDVAADDQPSPNKPLSTIIVDQYYPYTFVNQKGIPDGYCVDLIKAVTKVMGLEIDIHVGPWEQAMKALETGKIDLLPMMAYSKERDKLFDFSVPHTISYDAVFVPKNHNAIRSKKDLIGKRLIVMKDDAAHQYIVSKGLTTADRLVLTDSLPEALRLLAVGKGDAALMPKLVGLLHLKKLGLNNLEHSPIIIDDYNRPFSFAVRKGKKELLDRLTEGLNIIMVTGEYDQIHSKWFGMVEPSEKIMQSVIKYILITLAAVTSVALFLVVWFLSIKKQVALRTKELQQEISERKKAEEAMRKSEERFRIIFEQASVGIVEFTTEGRFTKVNQRFADITGYSLTELYELTLREVTHPEDLVLDLEDVRQTLAGEIPCFMRDNRYVRKDGATIWVNLCVSLVRDSQGIPKNFIGVVLDITERRRIEEALQTIFRRFQIILSILYSGILVVSEDNRVDFVNQAFCDLFQLDDLPEDLLGLSGPEMIQKIKNVYAHPSEEIARIQELVTKNQPVKGQEIAIRGKRAWMRDFIPIVIDGKQYGRLWHHHDITDRKKVELELKKAKEEAEAHSQELRKALSVSETLQFNLENAKNELEKLAEQAKQANRAKSDFLANMSHEIRTPLNAIKGFNKLLLGSKLSTQQKSFAESVSQASENLLLIINDL